VQDAEGRQADEDRPDDRQQDAQDREPVREPERHGHHRAEHDAVADLVQVAWTLGANPTATAPPRPPAATPGTARCAAPAGLAPGSAAAAVSSPAMILRTRNLPSATRSSRASSGLTRTVAEREVPSWHWMVRTAPSTMARISGLRPVHVRHLAHGVPQLERALGAVPQQEAGQPSQQTLDVVNRITAL